VAELVREKIMKVTMQQAFIAVHALKKLQQMHTDSPVPLSKLSELNLSLSYLEQVFSRLKKSGLVEGVRGPGGDYKPVQESYSLGEVIRALGGNGLLFSPAVLDALDAVPLSEV
jgi:Rrf2 family iron-sulfur cluster assembly transcriptional regulator